LRSTPHQPAEAFQAKPHAALTFGERSRQASAGLAAAKAEYRYHPDSATFHEAYVHPDGASRRAIRAKEAEVNGVLT
jgi:hypothetical protein